MVQAVRPVAVLTEDRRLSPQAPVRFVERMELGVVENADDCTVPVQAVPQAGGAGGWWVSANELLSKLQNSNSAIEGEFTWRFDSYCPFYNA